MSGGKGGVLQMKRLASFLLASVMMLSLAACGGNGLSLNQKEDFGIKYGRVGDAMSTEWFDFVVNEAYSCLEYHGYTPSAGCKLVVVDISLKNNCGKPVDVWGDDFLILWDGGDDTFDMDIPLPAGISDDQLPDKYVLDVNAGKSGVMVFEAPGEFRDFSIRFTEILESENPDGDEGSTYLVDFTAEDK